MSKETRQAHTRRISMIRAARGHSASQAHAFHHTNGMCPKCARKQLVLFYCSPDERGAQQMGGCEMDGPHLHVWCAVCKYGWIERCWDQAMLAEEQGLLIADSEAAAILALIAIGKHGIRLNIGEVEAHRGAIITFTRDHENDTITITAEPPKEQGQPNTKIPDDLAAEGSIDKGISDEV